MAAKNEDLQPISLYRRIEEDLRRRISNGEWNIGSVLPSRRGLAGDYQVTIKTVQRAIAPLVSDGTLEANPRRGTVLSPQPHSQAPLVGLEPARRLGQETGRRPSFRDWSADGGPPPVGRVLTAPATLGVVASFSPRTPLMRLPEYWVRSILTPLDVAFSRAGGNTRLFNRFQTDQVVASSADAVRRALEARVDALVVVDLDEHQPQDSCAEAVSRDGRNVPLVLITSRPLDWPIPHVFYDQRMAGYQAARHLIGQGYRPLVFLAPFLADWAEARIVGARTALTHATLPPQALHVFPVERTEPVWEDTDFARLGSEVMQTVSRGLTLKGAGIIAANDATALGVLRAGSEAGLTVGVDYGLVGFDDDPDATQQSLSTVRPPLEAMWEEAVRLVTQGLQGRVTTAQVRLHSHLIARASTATGGDPAGLSAAPPPPTRTD